MSAFILNREHIAYLIDAAMTLRGAGWDFVWAWVPGKCPGESYGIEEQVVCELPRGDFTEAARVGQMLWDENVRSVQYRYHGEDVATLPGPGGPYEYGEHRPHLAPVDPVQALKAANCYAYQSCEHPDWEKSEAFAFIETLKAVAIGELPGYDEAQSEIHERPTVPVKS